MQNNTNPMEMFKEITKGYDSKQMENLIKKAESMGFPKDVIEQVRGGIKPS